MSVEPTKRGVFGILVITMKDPYLNSSLQTEMPTSASVISHHHYHNKVLSVTISRIIYSQHLKLFLTLSLTHCLALADFSLSRDSVFWFVFAAKWHISVPDAWYLQFSPRLALSQFSNRLLTVNAEKRYQLWFYFQVPSG